MSMDKKDQFYLPPPKLSKSEQIMTFLWNPETSQFCGRTAGSWARIIIFYLIFYTALCAFWGGLWVLFHSVAIRQDKPRFQLSSSLIGTNPGLGYRPMPSEDHVESSLIWYRQDDNGFVNWTNQLENFLKPYKDTYAKSNGNPNIHDCSYDEPTPPGKVCRVAIDRMKPCDQRFFSYDNGSPCIFLKLNRIFNWMPNFFNETQGLPSNMPAGLRELIGSYAQNRKKELNTVWVSCEGENAADRENIGPIHLLPNPGFPGYFFPFANNPGYLSPLVAVWFEKPVRGVLINIECKAWAKNIEHDRHERRGSVHFEIMVD